MKNLLPILNNILEERPKRRSKWDKYLLDKQYYRNNWYNYIGKLAKVNTENLLGVHQNEIVKRYLHTLPEEYRQLKYLFDYLDISNVDKNGHFSDYRWGRPEGFSYGSKGIYYFDPNTEILKFKKNPNKRKKDNRSKEVKMKEFYEKKKAKNKRNREFNQQKEELYSELLHKIVKKRKDKEEKINLQKIVSHGFDPKTSFRPEYKAKT